MVYFLTSCRVSESNPQTNEDSIGENECSEPHVKPLSAELDTEVWKLFAHTYPIWIVFEHNHLWFLCSIKSLFWGGCPLKFFQNRKIFIFDLEQSMILLMNLIISVALTIDFRVIYKVYLSSILCSIVNEDKVLVCNTTLCPFLLLPPDLSRQQWSCAMVIYIC